MNETAIDEAVVRWADEVHEIYAFETSGKKDVSNEAGHLPVSESIAARIMANTGLDVFEYEHIVDTSSIRHILKNHGTVAEYSRGQVPVTEADIVQVAQLLLNPDTIKYTGKTKQGRDVLHYTKAIGGYIIFYTEEVRTKKNRLAAVTLYKRKNLTG